MDFAKFNLLSEIQGRLPETGEEPYAKLLDSNDKEKQMKKQKISTTVKAQEFIATDKAPAAAGPYSQGIKVYII